MATKKKSLTDLFIGVLKKNPLTKAAKAGVREGRSIIGKSLPKKKPRKPSPRTPRLDDNRKKTPKKRAPVFGSKKDRAAAIAQAEAELKAQETEERLKRRRNKQ